MNSCNFTGRLTKDPDLKTKQDGTGSYLFFTIAVDAGKDRNGEKQTDFIDAYASGQPAQFLSSYAHKGDLIEVTGRLHTSTREDTEGNKYKRYTLMVNATSILSKKEGAEARQTQTQAQPAQTADADVNPSDLPFNI